jgi:hypothetical protein
MYILIYIFLYVFSCIYFLSRRSLFPWHFGGGWIIYIYSHIYFLIYIFLYIFSYIYFLIYSFSYIFSYIYFPQILTPLSPVGRPGHPDAVCFLGTWGGWQVRDIAHILSSAFFFFHVCLVLPIGRYMYSDLYREFVGDF